MKKRRSMQLGYWGGHGTATVSFDTMGYDWSGNELDMLRTEQHHASPPYGTTYTQAMGVSGWGSIGGIIVPRPILKATDAHTGLYSNEARRGASNLRALGGPLGQLIGGVADLLGKIWALPMTTIGLAFQIVQAPFAIANGGGFQLENNAIQLVGSPFGKYGDAITFGNTETFFNATQPSMGGAYANPAAGNGLHEQGHTYQYQTLGIFFLPAYFLGGSPFTLANPYEAAAQQYALQHGPPPGGYGMVPRGY